MNRPDLGPTGRRRAGQSGFSLVEMLMAAFILAIGILGLTMLQTLSIRSQTGSKSMDTAIQLGQRILDQAEMTGRNSVISSRAGVTLPTLNPNYFGTAAFTQNYDNSALPVASNGFYTVVVTPTTTPGGSVTGIVSPIAGLGGIAMVALTVTWTESLTASNQKLTRSVSLSRRINYATS